MKSTMQDAPLLISDILRHGQQVHGDSTVITVEEGGHRAATFAEVATRAEKLAAALTRLGVQPGDRVGTFAWNNQGHLEAYLAIPSMGAVLHTLNIRLPADQLAYVVNHAEDRFIIVDASLIPLLAAVKDELKTVETIIVAGEGDTSPLGETLSYERLLAAEEPGFEWPVLDERSAAAMCYTSGTTGNPKGVVYSHRSTWLHTMAEQAASSVGMTESDRILIIVPMFHAMAWGTPYGAWMAGTDMIMPQMFLMGDHLAAVINEHHPTLTCGVPTIWNGLLALDTPIDFSSVRGITAGGAAVPQSLIEAFEKRFGATIIQGWGMTETSPLAAFGLPPARKHDGPRRHVLQGQGGPGRRRRRGARRGRGRDGAPQRRQVGRRVRDPRPVDHRLVLQGRGPGAVPRRLAVHRRRRHPRQPGLHDDLGPHQGRHQVRRASGSPRSSSRTPSWPIRTSSRRPSSPSPMRSGPSARWWPSSRSPAARRRPPTWSRS